MIEARGLSKRFGNVEVLRSLDVSIRRGRITAVVGPNGAGKTTFIKCVVGLTRLDDGMLTVNGVTVRNDVRYRAVLGFMPQIARFPENLTASDFFSLLKRLRNVDICDERLIDEFALRPYLERQLGTLSGGTRQKVNAVAAFLFRPELAILDEPTSGLDPIAAGVMKQRILRERTEGNTILITSHVLSEIEELADDIVYLADGRVQFAGGVEELRQSTSQQTIERAIATLMKRSAA